ncbi:MAG: hypothetical protein Q9159_002373 [Coniocarpon cinnabarinum]
MSHGAGLPPDWNQDRRPGLYAACIIFIAVTTLTVVVRLGLQIVAHRRLYWDDFFIVLAYILNLGLIITDMIGMTKGLGLHIDRVMASDPRPPHSFIALWIVGFVNSICIYLCLFCVKMSLLWLYRRLFWIAQWFRIGWYAALAFAIALVIPSVLAAIFQCTPVSYAWERMYLLTHIPPPHNRHISGTCIDSKYATYLASFSVLADVTIWALPFVAILKLQMNRRRKIELCGLLSLGFLACAFGLVKTVIIDEALSSADVSWANAPLAVWASAEQSTGILCASLPVIVGGIKTLHTARKERSTRPYHVDTSDASSRARNRPGMGVLHKGTFLKSRQDSVDDLGLEVVDFRPSVGVGGYGRQGTDEWEMMPRRGTEWL